MLSKQTTKDMAGINTPLIRDKLANFLDQPGEEIILYTRQHYLFLLPPLFFLLLFVSLFFTTSLFLLIIFHALYFLTPLLLCLLAFVLSATTKVIIDWYYHLYLVTTHKLIEIYYSPFFFYKTNTILLDQVRCTEIDEDKHGILEEVFDFGNINLTFDRPTHSEEFVLYHVASPTAIATRLRHFLTNSNEYSDMYFHQSKPTFFGRRQLYAH